MAIKRITISVPDDVGRRIKKAAGEMPVSQWVTELIEEHLDDDRLEGLWQEFCRDVAPTAADEKRARAMFKRLAQPAGRRRPA